MKEVSIGHSPLDLTGVYKQLVNSSLMMHILSKLKSNRRQSQPAVSHNPKEIGFPSTSTFAE